MSTQKMTGPFGADYAVPIAPPPPPPPKRCPVTPPPPPPPPEDWCAYPFYPPYPDMDVEPVPTPMIPGKNPPPPPPYPYPPVPEHHHHCAPCPPPYAPPRPEKVDESSRKLAKLSAKSKVLVQMIKDFEQKNKPAVLTIGGNSYQFGTNLVTDFNGEAAAGMYSEILCGDPIEELLTDEYIVDDSKTRVALKAPKDLLQSELARVRKEITLVAAALNNEVIEDTGTTTTVLGTDESAT